MDCSIGWMDDFRIYVELSDAYKSMDPASNAGKRRALAEHLKESIDSLEAKVRAPFPPSPPLPRLFYPTGLGTRLRTRSLSLFHMQADEIKRLYDLLHYQGRASELKNKSSR
jgi:hypothetical protein